MIDKFTVYFGISTVLPLNDVTRVNTVVKPKPSMIMLVF